MAAIFWMSARTSVTVGGRSFRPKGAVGNVLHVATFACLGYFLARACDRGGRSAGLASRAGRSAFAVAAVFGLTDEIHQFFTPGRVCSAYDVAIDALGAALALLWPRLDGPGRPRSPLPAAAVLLIAVPLAIVTGLRRQPGDAAIEGLLTGLGLLPG